MDTIRIISFSSVEKMFWICIKNTLMVSMSIIDKITSFLAEIFVFARIMESANFNIFSSEHKKFRDDQHFVYILEVWKIIEDQY